MTVAIEHWPRHIETALKQCSNFLRVTVFAETDSTQDAARRIGAGSGHVVVAGHQTAGRGRLGRVWLDSPGLDVTVSFVVPVDAPERLAVLAAVAVAEALQTVCGASAQVGIKWPNDIVAENQKLGGILIEQHNGCAFIGVGINVLHDAWPAELAARAISFRQLGIPVDRLQVVLALLDSFDHIMDIENDMLARRFLARDVLSGTAGDFFCRGERITGRVLRVDPMRGLVVQTEEGERWLPAAITSTHPPVAARR